MSNKNKGNKVESFVAEPVVIEEAPIEEAPVAVEEVKEESKEIPEVRQEQVKPAPQVKAQPKNEGRVILITRDGCIVENTKVSGDNRRLFGADLLDKKIGDIVEF